MAPSERLERATEQGPTSRAARRRRAIILDVILVLVLLAGVYLLWRASVEIRGLRQQVSETRDEAARLDGMLAAANRDLARATGDLEGLRRENRRLKAETDGRRASLLKEQDDRRTERNRLQSKIAAQETRIATLNREKDRFQREANRLALTGTQTDADLARVQAALTQQRADHDRLKKQLAAARDSLGKLNATRRDNEKRIADLVRQLRLTKAEFATFRQQYGPLAYPIDATTPLIRAGVVGVERVADYVFVTLSAGAEKGVKERMKFILRRGETQTGTVRIIEAEATSALGVVTLPGTHPPAAGDDASTEREPE